MRRPWRWLLVGLPRLEQTIKIQGLNQATGLPQTPRVRKEWLSTEAHGLHRAALVRSSDEHAMQTAWISGEKLFLVFHAFTHTQVCWRNFH